MPKRNLSAPATDDSRSRSPACMWKRGGFPLRNCRCRPIPSSRGRAPGSDFARRLSQEGGSSPHRPATYKAAFDKHLQTYGYQDALQVVVLQSQPSTKSAAAGDLGQLEKVEMAKYTGTKG